MNYKSDLAKYLKTQICLIERLLPRAFQEPTGESVHALRMATRRVRSTLWLLEHSSVHLHFGRLETDLHRLGKALGCVRELDVAISDAKHYGIGFSDLKDRRKIAKTNLRLLLGRAHYRKLLAQLSDLEKAVQSKKVISLQVVRRHLHTRIRNQLRGHIHGQSKLHRLRILMKKTQYVLEAMGSPVKPIRRLQCILGDAHDLELLQAATKKHPKLKKRQHALNNKSARLVKPVLHFAAKELERR